MIARWMVAVMLMGVLVPGALRQGIAVASATDAKAAEILLPGATYDVATIKPSDPKAMNSGMGMRPSGGFYSQNQTLRNAVCSSYEVDFFQCLGGPAWFESDRYDIEAKPDSATAERLLKLDGKQRWPVQDRMNLALFADRLKLKTHFETREMPIFALVVAKGGLRMHEAKAGDAYENGLKGGDGKPYGGGMFMVSNGMISAQGLSMDALAAQLQGTTNHIVSNKTGLTGVYDFTLQYSNSDLPAPDSTTPSIYTAVEEQLGMKLESTRGPVQVLVIDHVERPTEN